ncbi:MAG: DUF6326 family protein [Eubacteriales bacterium]
MNDRKAMLSTLWIFLTVNYIFCDVFSSMDPIALKELVMTGGLSGMEITQGFLLIAAISMEIPMVMILLSRVLNYRINRWTNIIVGIIMATYQILTMNVGTPPTLHYIFFSMIEVASCLIIVWNAWKWSNPEVVSNSKIKV